jgi:integrase/recombinase XerD
MGAGSEGRRRGPIVVAGPLAPCVEALRRELAVQGYAMDTISGHVRLLADLSDWLSARGQGPADLEGPVVEEFLRDRRMAGCRTGITPLGLAAVLGFLRRTGAAPPVTAPVAVTPLDRVLADYRAHLRGERGLSPGTVVHYLRCARRFLTWLPGSVTEALAGLSAGQVTTMCCAGPPPGRRCELADR